MDNKRRRYFVLYDKRDGCYMGRGTYYEEGNVQVYLDSDPAARQMRLADALMLENVGSFAWVDEEATDDNC